MKRLSADHRVRPIIVPRDLSRLPWCAGYAECINAGKSTWNEDQATAMRGDLKLMDSSTSIFISCFQGLMVMLERLMAIPGDILLAEDNEAAAIKGRELIIGAIELVYRQMDQMVEQQAQKGGGGCTALTVLFLNGRLYAAGAGDSRTILVLGESERALTRDHTPDSELNHVRALGFLKSHFTSLEFKKRPLQRNLGQMVLHREPYMTGWAYKVLAHSDLKITSYIWAGVMGTIGVTRGFGDHGLKAANTGVSFKPFLSSQPEVQCLDLEEYNLTEKDCIIMATDGLWFLTKLQLTMGAQEFVQAARGRLVGRQQERRHSINSMQSSSNDAT
ncbi:hypothetical protein TSAR_005680 [Trichomalopsis sarcophagae]|uniref:PPM-type phosphatase domain-containing protein n=1 Tax=Trichomalopsis sarcophagae TaxID=543379 RepID=A0A232EKC4_9HYME|nr:hypothetical protein TSAR_005680 [Trichomalopsis sarcophagae]